MPTLTAHPDNLARTGPIINLQIAPGAAALRAMQAASQPTPESLEVSALIDTGASLSDIKQGLPGKLGLQPIGIVHIHTAASINVPCAEYQLRLLMPTIHVAVELSVIEAPLQDQLVQFLLGRDALAQCVFIYNGTGGSYSLSF